MTYLIITNRNIFSVGGTKSSQITMLEMYVHMKMIVRKKMTQNVLKLLFYEVCSNWSILHDNIDYTDDDMNQGDHKRSKYEGKDNRKED